MIKTTGHPPRGNSVDMELYRMIEEQIRRQVEALAKRDQHA